MKITDSTALIKPVSALCPMRCSYCFYNDIASKRNIFNYPKMSLSTLETIIEMYTNDASRSATFLFQGGEPLAAGLDFFSFYVKKIRKIAQARPELLINSCVQTSGILINDKFAHLFKEGNFLVGISLDGPQEIHDANRRLKNGFGTFDKVMRGIQYLEDKSVAFNILCVINQNNVREAVALWNFFKEKNFSFLQFIPALSSIDSPGCLISDDEYANFVSEIFNSWYEDFIRGNYISVRFIDDLFAILAGKKATSCDMQGHCTHQHVIEADGSVYPCDFYVLDKFKISKVTEPANINHQALTRFLTSPPLFHECPQCCLHQVCRCGCKRYLQKDGRPFLCKTYKMLFKKYKEQIDAVLKIITSQYS